MLPWTKNHLKQTHRTINVKLIPLIPNKSNADDDCFVLVPKNCVPKSLKRVQKDTFGLDDLDKLAARPEICRTLLKCALCDFLSKVRRNLVKHLKLHKVKTQMLRDGDIKEVSLSAVCPVNPPIVENNSSDQARTYLKELVAGEGEGGSFYTCIQNFKI